jgi:TRAP-type C4-dicarboxylate transport system permease small subunit
VTAVLDALARAFALGGGALLALITGMSVVSIAGRTLLGKPVPGDFELVQVGCAAAIAAFLPYCQLRRGNIIVDFFTGKASPATQRLLDRAGALLLGAAMALLAWRAAIGGINAWKSQAGTMMLGFPEWIVYAGIVPGLALTAVIGVRQALFGFGPKVDE